MPAASRAVRRFRADARWDALDGETADSRRQRLGPMGRRPVGGQIDADGDRRVPIPAWPDIDTLNPRAAEPFASHAIELLNRPLNVRVRGIAGHVTPEAQVVTADQR